MIEESILKLATSDQLQFGATTLILIAIFFYFLKSTLNTNKDLVEQNQKNIAEFLNQLNHQQTQNRDALTSIAGVVEKMNDSLEKNNEVSERLIDYLKPIRRRK